MPEFQSTTHFNESNYFSFDLQFNEVLNFKSDKNVNTHIRYNIDIKYINTNINIF